MSLDAETTMTLQVVCPHCLMRVRFTAAAGFDEDGDLCVDVGQVESGIRLHQRLSCDGT